MKIMTITINFFNFSQIEPQRAIKLKLVSNYFIKC